MLGSHLIWTILSSVFGMQQWERSLLLCSTSWHLLCLRTPEGSLLLGHSKGHIQWQEQRLNPDYSGQSWKTEDKAVRVRSECLFFWPPSCSFLSYVFWAVYSPWWLFTSATLLKGSPLFIFCMEVSRKGFPCSIAHTASLLCVPQTKINVPQNLHNYVLFDSRIGRQGKLSLSHRSSFSAAHHKHGNNCRLCVYFTCTHNKICKLDFTWCATKGKGKNFKDKQKISVLLFIKSYTPILCCFINLRKQNCSFNFCKSCCLSFLYLKLSLADSLLEGKGNSYIEETIVFLQCLFSKIQIKEGFHSKLSQ